jgi:mevalonate kinase
MEPRVIQLNSRTLQEAFPDVYRLFFSKNTVVVSAPRSFWWTGEYAELFGGPTVTQKLPLRVYVGIEGARQGTIDIGDYTIFSPSKQQFVNQRAAPLIERTLVKSLSRMITTLLGSHAFDGFRIHVLSELPFGHGLAGTGSLAAAIITGLALFFHTLDPKEVERWKARASHELLARGSSFESIHRQAWKLETMIDSPRSSGSRSFSAMISGLSPTVHFTERRSGTDSAHPNSRVPCKIESHHECIDDIARWGFRIDELLGGTTPETLPMDIGLLFTGEEKITANVIRAFDDMETGLNAMGERLYSPLKRALEQFGIAQRPFFYDLCDSKSRGDLWSQYIDALAILALETVESLHAAIQSGGSKATVTQLTQKLRAYQDGFHLLDVSTPRLDSIRDVFAEIIDGRNIEPFGLKFTGSGGGGDFLFVSDYGSLHEGFDDILSELRERCGGSLSLDYASWRDGATDEGIRIDQMLEASIFSPYVSRGSIFSRWWGGHGNATARAVSYEQFDEERRGIDLLLDLPEQKIFIRGEELHSDEIHSAKTSIAILHALLQHYGKPVSAAVLGNSSYIDRNEMQSKILTPLAKAYRRRTKKKLPVRLEGGLRKNFVMKFEPSTAVICCIEKRL